MPKKADHIDGSASSRCGLSQTAAEVCSVLRLLHCHHWQHKAEASGMDIRCLKANHVAFWVTTRAQAPALELDTNAQEQINTLTTTFRYATSQNLQQSSPK